MLTHVSARHLIRDSLKAERSQKPIENLGRVELGNCVSNAFFAQIGMDIIEKGQRSCQTADLRNQLR
jgi:hypothetical protein